MLVVEEREREKKRGNESVYIRLYVNVCLPRALITNVNVKETCLY